MSDTQGKFHQNAGTCRSVDCDNQPTDIPEYADISGLGVLLGFLIAAYLVIMFLIGYYVFAFDPRLDIFRAEDDTSTIAPTINIVDDFVLRKVHYVLRKTRQIPPFSYLWSEDPDKGKEFHKVMNQCVYALVDSQSITGIAILVSGYYSLHCGVSSFHWYLIVYLAWFASLTHLSGLTFLRNHLHNHQGARSWRLFCMFVLLVLLAVALFPTAHFDLTYIDYNDNSIIDRNNTGKEFRLTDHAVCYFKVKEQPGGILPDRWDSMVVSMALLVYGYLIRALKLFRGPRGTWYRFKREWKDSCQKFLRWMASIASDRWPAWMRFTYGAVFLKPWVLLYILLRGLLHYYVSMASEIYWLLVSAAWGTGRLFYLKFSNGAPPENDWSFGQLVPLLMLASPLVLLYEYTVRAVKATLARKRQERKLSSRDLESEPRRQNAQSGQDKSKLLTVPESSHSHPESHETGASLLQVPRQTQQATIRSDSDSTLLAQPSPDFHIGGPAEQPTLNGQPTEDQPPDAPPPPHQRHSSSSASPLPPPHPVQHDVGKPKSSSTFHTFLTELFNLTPESPTDYLTRIADLDSYLGPSCDRLRVRTSHNTNNHKPTVDGTTTTSPDLVNPNAIQPTPSFHTRNNTHPQPTPETQISPSYQSSFLLLLIITTLGDSILVLGLIFYQPRENVFTIDGDDGFRALAVQFVNVQLLSMLVHINTCHALGSVGLLKRRTGWRTFAYGVVTVLALAAMYLLGLPVLIAFGDEWEYHSKMVVGVVVGTVGVYWVWYVVWGIWKAVVWQRYEKLKRMERNEAVGEAA